MAIQCDPGLVWSSVLHTMAAGVIITFGIRSAAYTLIVFAFRPFSALAIWFVFIFFACFLGCFVFCPVCTVDFVSASDSESDAASSIPWDFLLRQKTGRCFFPVIFYGSLRVIVSKATLWVHVRAWESSMTFYTDYPYIRERYILVRFLIISAYRWNLRWCSLRCQLYCVSSWIEQIDSYRCLSHRF